MTQRPKIGCHVQTWGAVRVRAAGSASVGAFHFESAAPFHAALSDIRLLGFDGVEAFDGDLLAWDRQGLAVGDMGLDLCGVYTGGYLIYDDLWPEERERFGRVCELASKHGSANVVLGAGAVRSSGVTEADLQRIADRVGDLSRVASDVGVVAHYHPHPAPGGHAPADIDAILQRTQAAICPDLAVLEAGGVNAPDFVRRHADRIDYAHLKDALRGVDVEVGYGDIDLEAVVRPLLGPNGASWLVTELDASHTAPVESARAMLARVRDVLAVARGEKRTAGSR